VRAAMPPPRDRPASSDQPGGASAREGDIPVPLDPVMREALEAIPPGSSLNLGATELHEFLKAFSEGPVSPQLVIRAAKRLVKSADLPVSSSSTEEALAQLLARLIDVQVEEVNRQVAQAARELEEREKILAYLADLRDLASQNPVREHIRQYLAQTQRLQSGDKSVKTKNSMELDPQAIIEQAQAEAQQPPVPAAPAPPPHPAPDTVNELEAIADEAAQLKDVLTKLRERDIPLTPTEAELAVTGLHEIATRSTRTARQLGLHATEHGLLSQLKVAQLLRVSSATVNRWFHRGLDADEAGRLPDRRSYKDSN
jgi:hypothetical protein